MKKKKISPMQHPLWEEFASWIVNGIHFNLLPFDQMFDPTMDNFDEWIGYWNAFMYGVDYGARRTLVLIGEPARKIVYKELGIKEKK